MSNTRDRLTFVVAMSSVLVCSLLCAGAGILFALACVSAGAC